jgi:hypothetical protein
MRIDVIEQGAAECPLIRIFGRDESGILELRDAIRSLRVGTVDKVAIHELPAYQAGSTTSLFASVAKVDAGVRKLNSLGYAWTVTPKTWAIVEDLIDGVLPLTEKDVHQWLAGGEARYGLEESAIAVLLSVSEKGVW